MKYIDMRIFLSVLVLINLFIVGCPKPQQQQSKMEDVQNYNKLGISYGKKGQYDQAIFYFNKALEINPKIAVVYYNRGLAYDNKSQYDQAISDYTKAIELNQRYADAYYNSGLAYDNKSQYDQAISDYSKTIEIDPKYASAYNNRGFAYFLLKEYDKAWNDFNKAQALGLKLQPDLLKNLRKALGRE